MPGFAPLAISAGLKFLPDILKEFGLGPKDSPSRPARPKLGVMPATQELVSTAKSRVGSQLPGIGVARQSQQTAMANMLSNARRASNNPTDLLQIAASGAAEERAMGADLAIKQDAYSDQALRDYMQSLGILADEQKDVFDYNENMPFQLAMAERNARMIAENQMKAQRFSNTTSLLSALLSSDAGATGVNALLDWFKKSEGGV